MSLVYKTALIGLGKMGKSNANDATLAKHYKYSSHIEVLNDHPSFDCGALYDQDKSIEGQSFNNLDDLANEYQPEILVLATPPKGRIETIKKFSNLKAIIMEKPVAHNIEQAKDIIDYCSTHNIILQINYWRRFDQAIIDLKDNLNELVGNPQVIFMTYGNGIRNNAVHLIDQVRYMFGEIVKSRALSTPQRSPAFPIRDDVNVDFQLTLKDGGQVYAHALDFDKYREVGVDIWGDKGRVEFIQGGLVIRKSSINNHRALNTEQELTSDQSTVALTEAGNALYNLYDNLANAINGKQQLFSSGSSALNNERILDEILT